MSYRGLVLPAAAASFVEAGGRDLPLDLAGTAEPLEAGRPLRLVGQAGKGSASPSPIPRTSGCACWPAPTRAWKRSGPRSSPCASSARWTCAGRSASSAREPPSGSSTARATASPALRWTCPSGVLYVYSRAFVPPGQLLAQAAIDQAGVRGVVIKVRSRGAASQQRVKQETVGEAAPETLVVEERGVPFEVHPGRGLNTGLFTDMREHRHGLARFVAGRAVLNGFAYTGTLSVVAARAGRRKRGSVIRASALRPARALTSPRTSSSISSDAK